MSCAAHKEQGWSSPLLLPTQQMLFSKDLCGRDNLILDCHYTQSLAFLLAFLALGRLLLDSLMASAKAKL